MATARIDVTIDGLTNEQVDESIQQVRDLLKVKFPNVEVEINGDTDYDPLATAED